MWLSKSNSDRGFTLPEIIAFLTVAAGVLATVVGNITGVQQVGKKEVAMSGLSTAMNGLLLCRRYSGTDTFPSSHAVVPTCSGDTVKNVKLNPYDGGYFYEIAFTDTDGKERRVLYSSCGLTSNFHANYDTSSHVLSAPSDCFKLSPGIEVTSTKTYSGQSSNTVNTATGGLTTNSTATSTSGSSSSSSSSTGSTSSSDSSGTGTSTGTAVSSSSAGTTVTSTSTTGVTDGHDGTTSSSTTP